MKVLVRIVLATLGLAAPVLPARAQVRDNPPATGEAQASLKAHHNGSGHRTHHKAARNKTPVLARPSASPNNGAASAIGNE